MASSSTDDKIFLLGCKFDPDESEIVRLLEGKESGCINDEGFHFIEETQLYDHEPWKLSSLSHQSGDKKMYFFTRLHHKSGRKGNIFNRRIKDGGFWRKKGEISKIKGKDGKEIAQRTSLTYYGEDNQSKPGWLMKEYMLITQNESKMKSPWALCVVYYKPPKQ